MATKAAITTPNALDLRAIQAAIAGARQRIEALEKSLAAVAGQAGQTAYSGGGGSSTSTVAIQTIQAQITALDLEVNTLQGQMAALLGLADGFVAVSTGVLVSRTLVAGANITITNPTGAGGAPVIASTASGGGGRGEFILVENDDFLLTESSLHLVVE